MEKDTLTEVIKKITEGENKSDVIDIFEELLRELYY